MRKMKSRVLAVLMAAGMIFTAQGMTVLAGTTGIGAAKTASQTGGPGEVKQDIGTVTVDDTQETSGETGQNTGSQENAGGTVQPSGQDPLQVNYSVYFRNQGWSNPAADNQALSASSESWVTSMKANLINIPSGAQIGVRYKVNLSGTGWLDWKADGVENGGASAEKPLEAIAMELTGSSAASYDLYYKVYQNGSWTDWAVNGATAGTEGAGLRVDGIKASITAKDAGAPAETASSTVDPSKPMIALTFDDGPRASVTNRILDSLSQYGGRATFFMVGTNVPHNGDVIRRMVAQGCEVANHTNDHKYISKLSSDGIVSQVSAVNQKVAAVCGVSPVVMRPPGGYVDAHSLSVLGSMGMPAIMWSIDTRDWQHRNAASHVCSTRSKSAARSVCWRRFCSCFAAAASASAQRLPPQGSPRCCCCSLRCCSTCRACSTRSRPSRRRKSPAHCCCSAAHRRFSPR